MGQLKRRIKIFLLDLFYRKLWIKIAIVLLVIVTIPVVVLGVLLIDTSVKTVRKSVLSNHKAIVARAAEEIKLFMRSPQDILANTAGIFSTIHSDPW
jgi:Tfp pilus assembly protein PilN